jgi:hypothetical protein
MNAVLDAVGLGGRTHRIAARLGWTTAKTRRALGKLERDGRVERHEHYTASNDIYWLQSTRWQQRLQPDYYGCPYLGTPKPCPLCDCARRKFGLVDSEQVARIIETAEIAPIIKQRLIAELIELSRDSDGSPKGGNAEGGTVHDSADPKGIAR